MATKNTYRILIWIIVVLLATNLSMGISFLYHKQQDKKFLEQQEEADIEVPSERRTRFFREQLNLGQDQMDIFRELNRNYNKTAWRFTRQLETLRTEMIREMGKENPREKTLNSISEQIGELHTNLKKETIDYYMQMKEVCNEEQQIKLNEIFLSMLKKKEDVSLPRYGRHNQSRR